MFDIPIRMLVLFVLMVPNESKNCKMPSIFVGDRGRSGALQHCAKARLCKFCFRLFYAADLYHAYACRQWLMRLKLHDQSNHYHYHDIEHKLL